MMLIQETSEQASKVGTDLFFYVGQNNVLVLDYYSHFPENALLYNTIARDNK